MEESELLMTLRIAVTGAEKVESDTMTVQMVFFGGTAEGLYFTGTIGPGGVHTQRYPAGGKGTLSARYMLSGTDCEVRACRMFIENNTAAGADDGRTEPHIVTDSDALRWMERARLYGTVSVESGSPVIRIFRMPQDVGGSRAV